MKSMLPCVRALLACLLLSLPLALAPPARAAAAGTGIGGAAAASPPTIAQATAGFEKKPGLLNLYLDAPKGKVWLEVPAASGRRGEVGSYLYVEGLVSGLGSNPVGLDRGQLGDAKVVTLRRVGGRLLVEEQNLKFRALTDSPAESQAIHESFATSVLWAGEITATDADGRGLVDLTSFLIRDAHEVAARVKAAGQGSFSLDTTRSTVDLESCLAFPENLEFEALLTYQSSDPGPLVRATAATGTAVTLVQHQSLLKLPDDGYRPRRFDPRSGSYSVDFADYAAPLTAPIDTHYLVRHRLEKVDPTAARSKVRKPIVYYVDSGAPEPVRTALVTGAGWWKEAFEKAGFEDAFRVEVLPPGVHPLDARYNVIQWVHRSTRGWSYGGGVIDPRTGEMVKGMVTLGSLRVRQDKMIFEGLIGAEKSGTGAPDDPIVLSLSRIRQLAAHEVGHALGFSHNFAASTYGGRASVMDYPSPLIGIHDDQTLDFSHAYAVGVGEWDAQAVRYAYSQFPPGADEAAALDAIAQDSLKRGYLFLTDEDSRPPGAAHPLTNLWDNGPDPVAGLEKSLAIRRIALSHFGEHNLAAGRPLTLLQEVLVPVYFHHRYQLDGAVKVVGGLTYSYALRGDGQPPARPTDGAWQRRALKEVLTLLSPAELDLPEPLLGLLLPRAPGTVQNQEMFKGDTDPTFDPLAAASTAADMAVSGLLQPERAARLVDFHRRDPKLPGLEEVLGELTKAAFGPAKGRASAPRQAEIARTVQWVVVRRMIDLSRDRGASPGVRARVEARLAGLRQTLSRGAGATAPEDAAQHAFLAAEIGRYLDRKPGEAGPVAEPPAPPPGQPIGGATTEAGLAACSWGE